MVLGDFYADGLCLRVHDGGQQVTTKIFTIAHVPEELQQTWMQHLRDFDVKYPGCHFEVAIDAPPDMPLAEIVQKLVMEPALTFQQFFTRGKPNDTE